MIRSQVFVIALLALVAGCSNRSSTSSRNHGESAGQLEVIQCRSGGEMVRIPAGRFLMGDADGSPDAPPHEVEVDAFYMDRDLVTQRLFEKVAGKNPSKHKGLELPVEQIQWVDAARFCNRCSELEGLAPCYDPETWTCNFDADGYRLPTEAEWEYACRAGTRTTYFFGNDGRDLPKYAWYKPHSRGHSHPIGTRRPNPWGLHDMLGNVWQWCNDYYSETYYQASPRENPTGPATGKQRVLRGGSWKSTAAACRPSSRQKEFPVFTDACFGADSYGFRRVRGTRAKQDSGQGRVAQAAKGGKSPVKKQQVETTAQSRNVPQVDDGKQNRSSSDMKSGGSTTGNKTPSPKETPEVQGKIAPRRLAGSIVFASDRGGSLDIWIMQADGSHVRQLTHDAHADADPRFSPDGKQILFTSLRDGFPQIWLMEHDGSKPRRLTEGSQGAWAPDGKSIVFIRDDQTFVRNFETGKERRLTPADWNRCGVPAWSPDGKQIALASRHLGDIGIFLLATDGKSPRKLPTEDPCCTPHWSPDGKRMVFQTTKGHIHELNIEDGTEEQLTFGAAIHHDACYSPDGTLLAFCRAPTAEGPWQICIVDLSSDDLDVVQLTHQGSNRLPDWH